MQPGPDDVEAEWRADASADQLLRLQRISEALAAPESFEQLAAAVIDEVVPALGADGGVVTMVGEDGRLEVLKMGGYGDISGQWPSVPLDSMLPISEAVRLGHPIWLRDADDRHLTFPATRALGGVHEGLAALPLRAGTSVIGSLGITFAEPHDFTTVERAFLLTVAQQCAIAIERCRLMIAERRLYESERAARAQAEVARAHAEKDRHTALRLAQVLQTSLLPPELPFIPGVELAARYHPALEGADVGGDFYDVFDTGGDWAIVIGDVCGKGPEAAALTALARNTLRTVAVDVRQPASVLRRLNEVLYRNAANDRFCTVAYGRLVPTFDGVRISVSCGGHLPPLILRADGTVEPIGSPGYLIGIFPDIRLWEETAQLGAGDAIVLYTDGVTEAPRGAEQFGEERLAELVSTMVGLPAATMAKKIEDAVLEFGGPQPRDDIALLVLRVNDVGR